MRTLVTFIKKCLVRKTTLVQPATPIAKHIIKVTMEADSSVEVQYPEAVLYAHG